MTNTSTFAIFHCVSSINSQRQYKDSLSGFNSWNQKLNVENQLLFTQNIVSYLAIHETVIYLPSNKQRSERYKEE